jgi:hypothetical protein
MIKKVIAAKKSPAEAAVLAYRASTEILPIPDAVQ